MADGAANTAVVEDKKPLSDEFVAEPKDGLDDETKAELKEKLDEAFGDEDGIPPKPDGADETDGSVGGEIKPVGDEQGKPGDEETLEISAELLGRAKSYGLSEDEANAYGDSVHLERTLAFFDRKLATPERDNKSLRQEETPKIKAEEQKEAPKKFEVALDPDTYDPEVIKTFNDMRDFYDARLEEQGKQIQAMRSEQNVAYNTQLTERVDGIIAGFGDEWKDIFGEGSTAALDVGGEHYKNRDKVYGMMDAIAENLKRRGEKIPHLKELLNRARAAVFTDKIETMTRKSIAQKVTKRNKQGLARPAGRKNLPAKGSEAKAKGAISDKMEELDVNWDS